MRLTSLRTVLVTMFFIVSGLLSPQLAAENMRYELVESSRAIMRVGPNQTLDDLVEQVYAGHKLLWPQIKKKIRAINPQAFNRYTGNLIVGQRLQLVTVKKIRELDVQVGLTEVGKASLVQGRVIATDKRGHSKSLQQDSLIYEGDRITTEKGSRAIITLIDDAEIRVRPDSSLRITEYVMKSGFERGSRSIIDLIKGGLRKITGAIAANPLSEYRMNSGVVTIGVRGTDYVVKLCRENDCSQSAGRNDADSRLHVAVLDGVITLEDEEGVRGELALGQYAIADQEKVVMAEEDEKPVPGLLEKEEQELFDKIQPPETKKEEDEGFWPWLLGGALFGIGL